MSTIQLVPAEPKYIAAFHRCVDLVARERLYLALTEALPADVTQAFVEALMAGGGIQYLAVDEHDRVFGWCDITRHTLEGFRHCGSLGMGLLPEVRGHGLGAQLAQATIDVAWAQGMERIELEVFASNKRALRLYRKLGFTVEGVRRKSRKLDGHYDDNVFMALLRTAT